MAEQEMEFCKCCQIPKNLCPKVCNVKIVEVERKILPQGTILHQDYQIYGVLGAGGMSVTYCACTRLEPVVLKQFNPMQANREGLDMEKERKKFGGEARKLRELKHPNIVHVENILEDEESKDVFLVMELLRGITLEEYLQKLGKPMSEQEAYKMLTPIFDALKSVHKAGIIHRDVKPSNIMVCDNGTMKLIDFGSARNENSYTKTIFLTDGYAPPEQYKQHGDQGTWTDVYSICATLYRMIIGKKPQCSRDRTDDKIEILAELQYGEVLQKGLALRSQDRWKNIEELCAALEITYSDENKTTRNRQQERDTSYDRATEFIPRQQNDLKNIILGGIKKYRILFGFVAVVSLVCVFEVLKLKPMEISSESLKGERYTFVIEKLASSGFSNIHTKEIADLQLNEKNKEYLVTDVNLCFGLKDSFDVDTKYPSNLGFTIDVVYHTLALQKPPMTSEEAKGRDYLSVKEEFENAGYINVTIKPENRPWYLRLGNFLGFLPDKDRGLVVKVEKNEISKIKSWTKLKLDDEIVVTYYEN